MQRKKLTVAVSMALCLSNTHCANAQFNPIIELNDLNSLNGFRLIGAESFDYAGVSASSAGDINGDGIDDIIIGAHGVNSGGNINSGSSYVVFGSESSLFNPFNLSLLNGTNGFTINGVDGSDLSGFSVSAAGDFNGDGIDDLIIGALYADPDSNYGAGSSYVVFGSDSGLPNPFYLSTLNGANGFTLNGIEAFDRSGRAVSAAGDFNGDGIDDIIISADRASPGGNTQAGSSYVVFGSVNNFVSPFNLSNLDGTNGFVLNGADSGHRSGSSVSAAGDINDDGFDDIIIGADVAGSGGISYVVYGTNSGLTHPLDLATLNGTNGITLFGQATGDLLGFSVSAAGDVNDDGIDDLIVGARGADPNGKLSAGSSYVVYGSDIALPNPFDLSSLDGSNGFTLNGVSTEDYSGIAVSSAGDINGDGIDDLIIGANGADPGGESEAGSSYVVFGSDILPHPFDLSTLDGTNGITLNGVTSFDSSGYSVNEAGDFNGDGIDDLIIGARLADPNNDGSAGSCYVVFGNDGIFKAGFE